MKLKSLCLYLLCILFFSPVAMATTATIGGPATKVDGDGAGSSGGGFLMRDITNPWWVQNTSDVRYCIDIAEGTFSLDRPAAELYIAKALDYWQKQFERINSKSTEFWNLEPPNNHILVATQRFQQVSCGADVDLRFQLGSLTKEQSLSLGDASSIIGIAVRTAYDRKNLRGKGYIYLAPDLGPGKQPSFGGKLVWQMMESELFYLALIHEIGHVFGVAHIPIRFNLMNENFIEEMTSASFDEDEDGAASDQEIAEALDDLRTVYPGDLLNVGDKKLRSSFCVGEVKSPGFRKKKLGLAARIAENLGPKPVLVKEGVQRCAELSLDAGKFTFKRGDGLSNMTIVSQAEMKVEILEGADELVNFWIPTEHSEFFRFDDPKGSSTWRRFSLVSRPSFEFSGDLIDSKGRKTPISFEVGPAQYTVFFPRIKAVVDGKLLSSLFATQPLIE